ncbi:MAG TPA: hypothetical protein VHF25_14370 [Nitriliruptorales bacterium]|nr:hypothetical protein [Nitriliruptorales bacterium]
MFDRPGIGIDDLPWIHRDQFVHYVELAHALSDPHDWPQLREGLLRALTAAFGLDAGNRNGHRLTTSQRRALELLDEIRCHHDPAADWSAFFDTLWARRHAIRPDIT